MKHDRGFDKAFKNQWFIDLLKDWWWRFSDILKDVTNQGYIPVIIAISRKMPRFLEWFREECKHYHHIFPNIEVLEKIQITTELAIPFLYVHPDFASSEFIILDDSVIHGSTLKKVSENLNILSGRKCHFSSIMVNRGIPVPNCLYLHEWLNIPVGSEKEIIVLTDIVSSLVEQNSLPIDMEFPIFNVEECEYEYLEKVSVDFFADRVYNVSDDPKRFSIDLSKDQSSGNDSDFAKIRFFKSNRGCVLEVFSPHILSEHQLVDPVSNPIQDPVFRHLWDMTTFEINEILRSSYRNSAFNISSNLYHEFLRSLCVWMNFLFSLACFTKNAKQIFIHVRHSRIDLSKKDLEYILGRDMANFAYKLLISIISSMHSMESNQPIPTRVPDSFAPSVFAEELESIKFEKALNASCPEDLFQTVFFFSHFSNPKFKNPYLRKERLFFGESFESLHQLMKYRNGQRWTEITLSRWVDFNIDKGFIIPRYDCVKSEDGNYYWRRFFHSGARTMYNEYL